jgi:4-hydroxy-3-polyprenylbenzoate decarboxylase
MAYAHLREYLTYLETIGQLRTISTLLTTDEISEITRRIGARADGPCLRFTNVEGTDAIIVTNVFGTQVRMASGLGMSDLAELRTRLARLLDLTIPQGMAAVMTRAGDLLESLKSMGLNAPTPRNVPCQHTRHADLSAYPALIFAPRDAYPSYTLAQVIVRDPDTGAQSITMPRLARVDAQRVAVCWDAYELPNVVQQARARGVTRLPIAIVFGGDPAAMWAADVQLPVAFDPYAIAGWLRNKPVPLAAALTQPLSVPANAEGVIEGELIVSAPTPIGRFAQASGLYCLEVGVYAQITAVTQREQLVLPFSIAHSQQHERGHMAHAWAQLFVPIVQMVNADIADVRLPAVGAGQNVALVSVRRRGGYVSQRAAGLLAGLARTARAQVVVCVDDDLDLQDNHAVLERVMQYGQATLTWGDVDARLTPSDHKLIIHALQGDQPAYDTTTARPSADAINAVTRANGNDSAWAWLGARVLAVVCDVRHRFPLGELAALLPTGYGIIAVPAEVDVQDHAAVLRHVLHHAQWEHWQTEGARWLINTGDSHEQMAQPSEAVVRLVDQRWLDYGV